jgi:hypothetical protein
MMTLVVAAQVARGRPLDDHRRVPRERRPGKKGETTMKKVMLFLALLASGCASHTYYVHGIPNLREVHPGLWRSGQPTTAEQWRYLKDLGVANVLKLNYDSEGSDAEATEAGLGVYAMSIQPSGDGNIFKQPDPEMLENAEAVTELPGTLVHCTHGQDRTGLVVGRHRVLHDGWSKDAADQEMRAHGFHPALHGLHESWEHFQGTKDDATSATATRDKTEPTQENLKKAEDLKPAKATKKKANTARLTNCRKDLCLREEDKCVPGCDPPDENNTVHGCSSCYSKKRVCVRWTEVCD